METPVSRKDNCAKSGHSYVSLFPMSARLFHVSEDASIAFFQPRPPPTQNGGVTGDAVWAIDEDHLPHYMLPVDCPRVALRAHAQTSPADYQRFFPDGFERVLAVEFEWYARIQTSVIYLYELPPATFTAV